LILDIKNIKYLVFDVESVPDGKLINSVRYPDDEIDDKAAVKKFQGEILEQTNGASDFIPVTFQYPVSICVAKVRSDFSLDSIICLDDPEFRTDEMVRLFWLGIEELYSQSSMVTFNGR